MELGNLAFGNSRGEYPLDRDEYEGIVVRGLSDIGCDCYGVLEDKDLEAYRNERSGITTPVFEICSYWWGDEDDPEAERPNFKHIPTGFTIDWYKYALRDSYANQDLDPDQVAEIFCECAKFVRNLKEEKTSGDGWRIENEKLDEFDVVTDTACGKVIRKDSEYQRRSSICYGNHLWYAYTSLPDGSYVQVGKHGGYFKRASALHAVLQALEGGDENAS